MAVIIRNGFKGFGSSVVLDNVNLTVEQGSIYGLLGASGCGKTTLLSCVVGLRTLDSGDAIVLGSRPGKAGSGVPGPLVGYMPQDVSLYPLFTIGEILAYYGQIYGMSDEQIESRTRFLAIFLNLPDICTRTETLSGGQERRVSLAVAMIHQPPLLILDEPTVGLDPLLREKIWGHLAELVKTEATTIIITTHYLEEARFCDTVGIMRNKRILVEENPSSLLSRFHTHSLESAVLQLCKEDEATFRKSEASFTPGKSFIIQKIWEKDVNGFQSVELKKVTTLDGNDSSVKDNNSLNCQRKDEPDKNNNYSNGSSISTNLTGYWRISRAIARKNFIIHSRHPVAVGAQLLLPLLQVILYNLIIGRDPVGQKVAYYSPDWSQFQNEVGYHNSSLPEYCRVHYKLNTTKKCFSEDLRTICKFMNQFDHSDIDWIHKSSLEDAVESVQLGKTVGYLEIPVNFSSHLSQRVLYRNFVENKTLTGSTLKLRLDMSDALSRAWLTDTALQRFQSFATELATDCDQHPRITEIPVKYNAIYGKLNDKQGFNKFVQPALIIGLMYILANLPGVIMVVEKRLGLTALGTVAGIRFSHMVMGSFMSETVMILAQVTILFLVLPFGYGMTSQGSWGLCIALVLLTSLAGLSSGFFWGSIYHHEMDIIMMNMFINSIMIISAGGFWPLECVVSWYRYSFCELLPVAIPTKSLRAIMFRGWGLEEPDVLQGFLVNIGWILAFISVSALIETKKK